MQYNHTLIRHLKKIIGLSSLCAFPSSDPHSHHFFVSWIFLSYFVDSKIPLWIFKADGNVNYTLFDDDLTNASPANGPSNVVLSLKYCLPYYSLALITLRYKKNIWNTRMTSMIIFYFFLPLNLNLTSVLPHHVYILLYHNYGFLHFYWKAKKNVIYNYNLDVFICIFGQGIRKNH